MATSDSGGAADPAGASPPGGPVRNQPGYRQSRRPSRGSRWRAAFFVLALVGIVGTAGWALLGSRLLVVRVISVTGTRLVPTAQVISAAGVPSGTPLIRVDPAQVAAKVEAIRQVASARVTKDWPDGLSITVRERVPAMTVRMSGGGYDLIDPDGVVVTWQAAKPAGLPLLATAVPGSRLRGDPGVATVAQVLASLPSSLSRQVATVSVSEPAQGPGGRGSAGVTPSVTLDLSGRQTVVWGDAGSAGVKARELAILMRDRASYYDVSAPGAVTTR
jgi:cell division protein FtsQ